MLTAETREEAEQKFLDWRQAIATRGMEVNLVKTKVMVTGIKAEVVRSGRYPCAVCGKGVGVKNAPELQCPTFFGQNQMEEPRDNLHLEGDVVEEV